MKIVRYDINGNKIELTPSKLQDYAIDEKYFEYADLLAYKKGTGLQSKPITHFILDKLNEITPKMIEDAIKNRTDSLNKNPELKDILRFQASNIEGKKVDILNLRYKFGKKNIFTGEVTPIESDKFKRVLNNILCEESPIDQDKDLHEKIIKEESIKNKEYVQGALDLLPDKIPKTIDESIEDPTMSIFLKGINCMSIPDDIFKLEEDKKNLIIKNYQLFLNEYPEDRSENKSNFIDWLSDDISTNADKLLKNSKLTTSFAGGWYAEIGDNKKVPVAYMGDIREVLGEKKQLLIENVAQISRAIICKYDIKDVISLTIPRVRYKNEQNQILEIFSALDKPETYKKVENFRLFRDYIYIPEKVKDDPVSAKNKKIIIQEHTGDNHYVSYLIERKDNKWVVKYKDSMKGPDDQPKPSDFILDIVAKLHGNQTHLTLEFPIEEKQQTNAWDCGLWAVRNSIYFASGLDVSLKSEIDSKTTDDNIRSRMLAAIPEISLAASLDNDLKKNVDDRRIQEGAPITYETNSNTIDNSRNKTSSFFENVRDYFSGLFTSQTKYEPVPSQTKYEQVNDDDEGQSEHDDNSSEHDDSSRKQELLSKIKYIINNHNLLEDNELMNLITEEEKYKLDDNSYNKDLITKFNKQVKAKIEPELKRDLLTLKKSITEADYLQNEVEKVYKKYKKYSEIFKDYKPKDILGNDYEDSHDLFHILGQLSAWPKLDLKKIKDLKIPENTKGATTLLNFKKATEIMFTKNDNKIAKIIATGISFSERYDGMSDKYDELLEFQENISQLYEKKGVLGLVNLFTEQQSTLNQAMVKSCIKVKGYSNVISQLDRPQNSWKMDDIFKALAGDINDEGSIKLILSNLTDDKDKRTAIRVISGEKPSVLTTFISSEIERTNDINYIKYLLRFSFDNKNETINDTIARKFKSTEDIAIKQEILTYLKITRILSTERVEDEQQKIKKEFQATVKGNTRIITNIDVLGLSESAQYDLRESLLNEVEIKGTERQKPKSTTSFLGSLFSRSIKVAPGGPLGTEGHQYGAILSSKDKPQNRWDSRNDNEDNSLEFEDNRFMRRPLGSNPNHRDHSDLGYDSDTDSGIIYPVDEFKEETPIIMTRENIFEMLLDDDKIGISSKNTAKMFESYVENNKNFSSKKMHEKNYASQLAFDLINKFKDDENKKEKLLSLFTDNFGLKNAGSPYISEGTKEFTHALSESNISDEDKSQILAAVEEINRSIPAAHQNAPISIQHINRSTPTSMPTHSSDPLTIEAGAKIIPSKASTNFFPPDPRNSFLTAVNKASGNHKIRRREALDSLVNVAKKESKEIKKKYEDQNPKQKYEDRFIINDNIGKISYTATDKSTNQQLEDIHFMVAHLADKLQLEPIVIYGGSYDEQTLAIKSALSQGFTSIKIIPPTIGKPSDEYEQIVEVASKITANYVAHDECLDNFDKNKPKQSVVDHVTSKVNLKSDEESLYKKDPEPISQKNINTN